MRIDGRANDQLRPVEFTMDYNRHAEGSVLVKFGYTHVLCTATVEPGVPKFLANTGQGWLTAEYGMLPRSTHSRIRRDKAAGSGRTQEISRLIGRSLRACLDMKKLGERQITIDCDVLQADGGTRTAAITGGFVALQLAIDFLMGQGALSESPILFPISAISVGLQGHEALLDLNYEEDSNIGTDMNFVMNSEGHFIEVQGTAEGTPFSRTQMDTMMDVAKKGCLELNKMQAAVLKK